MQLIILCRIKNYTSMKKFNFLLLLVIHVFPALAQKPASYLQTSTPNSIEAVGETGSSLESEVVYKFKARSATENKSAVSYWINEDFSGFSAEDDYIKKQNSITINPESITLTRYYANFEKIEGSCNDGITKGNVLRIRGQKDNGYVEFTVPNARTIRIALKAKSNDANRSAEVLINDKVAKRFDGLDESNCAVFEQEINSDSPVKVKIRGGDSDNTKPICINRIQVTKNSGGDNPNPPVSSLKIEWCETTTPLLTEGPVSGTIDDPTDPACTEGINFVITCDNASATSVSASSSDQSVVKDKDLILTRNGNSCNLKIKPSGVGYNTVITLVVTEGDFTKKYDLSYSASASCNQPALRTMHTGLSDASTAIAIDQDYFLVSDDESNQIRLYNRHKSGLPIRLYELGNNSNIDPEEPEMDIEASVRGVKYPNRVYWCGSLGNSKKGKLRESRNRLVVTELNANGAETTLTYLKHIEIFRQKLIAWGDDKGFDFSAAAAEGMIPKRIDGFNVEGMAIAPDNSTCYLGFRAPLIADKNNDRRLALIVQVKDFEEQIDKNQFDQIDFGTPILMDLEGRSIRSIERLKNGKYLIIAGSYDDTDNVALYVWSGLEEDTPDKLDVSIPPAAGETHPESFLEGKSTEDQLILELLNDNGTVDYYETGDEAKSLPLPLRKFSKNIYAISLNKGSITGITDYANQVSVVYPNPVNDYLLVDTGEKEGNVSVQLINVNGIRLHNENLTGGQIHRIDMTKYPAGIYFILINGESIKVIKK